MRRGRRRRRALAAAVLVAAGAVAGAVAARRPLGRLVGRWLVAADPLVPADAMVVLNGSVPDRILEAVALYRRRMAPRILLTRAAPLPGRHYLARYGLACPEIHEVERRLALRLGVPAAAITVLPQITHSTRDEAAIVGRYLLAHGLRSLIVVTSKAHSARARAIFRRTLGRRARVIVRPSRYDRFDPEGWWHERRTILKVAIEYGKWVAFWLARVRDALGLGPPSRPQTVEG